MIRYAGEDDLAVLAEHDRHISESELKNIIRQNRVLVMHRGDTFTGWLRYGLFWDSIPFMNMLYILDGYRGVGDGSALVSFWESEMAGAGYDRVLTSTQSNESAQFFYRKIGYTECGVLLLPNEPAEIIFKKELTGKTPPTP